MFYHGFDNYMEHAFPLDELKPLTCGGRTKDDDPDNWAINDVLGNYSVTLVDSLDMFAILGDKTEFEKAVRLTIDNVSFDLDSRVQVFESTIRMLGGLLSGHLIASDDRFGFKISDYKGELLEKARDLGDRLMPAFETPDGIPFPRVNLRQGVLSYEIPSACSAGAGTLLLEFGILTRLTGDKKYERAAKRAMLAVWDRRSSLDLVGNTMSLFKKEWIDKNAGLGAGVDSFYEYLLKSHILFGDREYLDMFQTSYKSILKNVRYSDGFIYKNVDMFTGNLLVTWIDSLAAFFPGLQVLGGDVINAVRPHHLYYTIWKRYKALPERFDFRTKTPSLVYYPLRPELIESTYMLYQATRDPFYLQVGEQLLEDIEERTRVKCGFASIGNVETGKLEDRMESFFLSETLKYLYLLFDEGSKFEARESIQHQRHQSCL
ncbi:glycoside hydrolase [Gorgonomyces haynaldii]|nr:glycoside hydrolase [Gorgonomyces haynaldii]